MQTRVSKKVSPNQPAPKSNSVPGMLPERLARADSAAKKHPPLEEVRLNAHTLPEVFLLEGAMVGGGNKVIFLQLIIIKEKK